MEGAGEEGLSQWLTCLLLCSFLLCALTHRSAKTSSLCPPLGEAAPIPSVLLCSVFHPCPLTSLIVLSLYHLKLLLLPLLPTPALPPPPLFLSFFLAYLPPTLNSSSHPSCSPSNKVTSLAGLLSRLERGPLTPKGGGFDPSCGFGAWSGHVQEAMDGCSSLTSILSPCPPAPRPLSNQ